jgi:hypothetical protein
VIVPLSRTSAQQTGTVTCPVTNPNVVSGGYSGLASGDTKQFTIDSYPNASNQWTVSINQPDPDTWTIYAVCAK